MCRTFCKHQTFQQGITCQTVRSMNAITTGLSNCIQMFHRSSAVTVYPDAAHEIVLRRNNRDPVLCHIISFFPASLTDIREMFQNRILIYIFHGKPHMIRSIFFHLLTDCFCHHIPRKKLIDKPLSVFVIKNCTFTTDRF